MSSLEMSVEKKVVCSQEIRSYGKKKLNFIIYAVQLCNIDIHLRDRAELKCACISLQEPQVLHTVTCTNELQDMAVHGYRQPGTCVWTCLDSAGRRTSDVWQHPKAQVCTHVYAQSCLKPRTAISCSSFVQVAVRKTCNSWAWKKAVFYVIHSNTPCE